MRNVQNMRNIALLLLLGGCSPTAEVDVSTRVGDPDMASQWLVEADPARLLTRLRDMPTPETVPLDPTAEVAGPTSPEQLQAHIEAIKTGSHKGVEAHARALAQAPAELWPQIREHILAPRKARKADYIKLLSLIGGDVPNRYGHFERTWKRAHGYKVKLSEDWYEDLLTLPSKRVSRVFRGIYRDSVTTA
ncbi:MAG: hypothetical protein ACPG77_12035, partial [Nannocystaceae bacterium]